MVKLAHFTVRKICILPLMKRDQEKVVYSGEFLESNAKVTKLRYQILDTK